MIFNKLKFSHKCAKKRDLKIEYKYQEMIDHYKEHNCDLESIEYVCPYLKCNKK